MFDVWKSIFAGFKGELSHHEEARKLVWLLIITGFFSLCCVFFAAYVSFSRYRDLAGILPGAEIVAICFTVGIAGFIFFASAYIATFTAEIWHYSATTLSGAKAITFFFVGLVVALGDYNMNIDGAGDVAEKAVGQVLSVNEAEIKARYAEDISAEQTKLDNLLAGKLGGYGWKSAKSGIYHLNSSGKTFQRSLSTNINRLSQLEADELAEARKLTDAGNAQRDKRKAKTLARLMIAVRSVYIIQFFLCLVMAMIGVSMNEALGNEIPVAKEKPQKNPKKENDDFPEEPAPTSAKEKAEVRNKTLSPKKVKKTQENAQILSEEEEKVYFNFFGSKPPNNRGKSYDVTANQLKKIKRLKKAYDALVKAKDDIPTQKDLVARSGMSEPTVRKYLGMMGLPTKGMKKAT